MRSDEYLRVESNYKHELLTWLVSHARATGTLQLRHVEKICCARLHFGCGCILKRCEHQALPANPAVAVAARRVQDGLVVVHAHGAITLKRVTNRVVTSCARI